MKKVFKKLKVTLKDDFIGFKVSIKGLELLCTFNPDVALEMSSGRLNYLKEFVIIGIDKLTKKFLVQVRGTRDYIWLVDPKNIIL